METSWGILFTHLWFSKAYPVVWQIIANPLTFLLNKWKSHALFISFMHLGKKLWNCCFPRKYVSTPDTRSFMLYFHKAQSCFYLLGNLTTSHESSGMISLGLIFTYLLSHWDHLYSHRRVGGDVMMLCKWGGPVTSWLMFSLFSLGCESPHGKVCVGDQRWWKRFKGIRVLWWSVRIKHFSGPDNLDV